MLYSSTRSSVKLTLLPQTFVAQNEEDYQLLNKLVNDTGEALGRKVRIPSWYRPWCEGAAGPSPLTEEEVSSPTSFQAMFELTFLLDAFYWFRWLCHRLHRLP